MRRILKYNMLSAVQYFLMFIFQVLLARYFGASIFTDAYFVSMIILVFISSLTFFFTGMFMQYYNDIKIEDAQEARKFYQAVYNFSLLVGVAVFLVTMILRDPIIKVFASGFDADKVSAIRSFFSILALSLIWSRLTFLCSSFVTAEFKFLLPYLLALLLPIFNILSVVFFADAYGINVVAISTICSGLLALAIYQLYIFRVFRIGFGFRFWHDKFPQLMKMSFSMKIGDQIWQLKDPITTNILSQFPVGTVSLYFYAIKVIGVLFTVINSPIIHVFTAKVSRMVSEENFSDVRDILRKTLGMNTGFFALVILPFAIFLKPILAVSFGDKFSVQDISTIHIFFLLLIPFHLIMSVELPFVSITKAMKHGVQVIKVGTYFILLYVVFLYVLSGYIGVYAVPVALAMAQIQNLAVYYLNVRRVLKEKVWNVQPVVLEN